jgi:DNA-binding GntR family transcriptional regulator
MATSRKDKPSAPQRKADVGPTDNLTTRVTAQIRQSIIDAEFALGEALSESILAARLGVSRTPVREALTALQRQGLIVIRPQSGSFVFMPTEEEVAELCEYRRLIECAAIRRAHARRRDETLAQLRQAIDVMDAAHEAGDQQAYSRADATFHQSIVDNSANRYLIEAYKLVSGCVGALRSHNLLASTALRRRSNAAHRSILAAFEKGDLPQVEQVIDEHVQHMAIGYRALRRREI